MVTKTETNTTKILKTSWKWFEEDLYRFQKDLKAVEKKETKMKAFLIISWTLQWEKRTEIKLEIKQEFNKSNFYKNFWNWWKFMKMFGRVFEAQAEWTWIKLLLSTFHENNTLWGKFQWLFTLNPQSGHTKDLELEFTNFFMKYRNFYLVEIWKSSLKSVFLNNVFEFLLRVIMAPNTTCKQTIPTRRKGTVTTRAQIKSINWDESENPGVLSYWDRFASVCGSGHKSLI